jgi:hypothetical protein
VNDHNAQAKPFQWVADPHEIIAAVRRGQKALDSIQQAKLSISASN